MTIFRQTKGWERIQNRMAIGVIEFIYYLYVFLALYMLSLFIMLYLQSRKEMFSFVEGIPEPVSIVMPCYNEGEHIGEAIDSLLNLDWPKGMLEIIVVDDRSTDNSAEVVRSYEKKYDNVRLIVNKKNSGGAAQPTNIGIRNAKHAYIAVADADSTPDRDALIKMIGFLQEDEKVGGVTCSINVKRKKNFIEKLQAIEYNVIAFTRKLLDPVESVYIMPGPFALYRKKILENVNGFDEKNMTQDIEMTWRLLSHGYKVRMCLATRVNSVAPKRFKDWWRQRVRWNIGGIQTLLKYRKLFLRKGILGFFVIPLFLIGYTTGLLGLVVFSYLVIRKFYVSYLSTKLSLDLGTDIFVLSEFNLSPSVLAFFGISLLILGLSFTLLGLSITKEKGVSRRGPIVLAVYFLAYLSIYPILLIWSFSKFVRGKYSW